MVIILLQIYFGGETSIMTHCITLPTVVVVSVTCHQLLGNFVSFFVSEFTVFVREVYWMQERCEDRSSHIRSLFITLITSVFGSDYGRKLSYDFFLDNLSTTHPIKGPWPFVNDMMSAFDRLCVFGHVEITPNHYDHNLTQWVRSLGPKLLQNQNVKTLTTTLLTVTLTRAC